MKLHIGCGKKFLEGWSHADVAPFDHIDFNVNAKDLEEEIDCETVDEIYACHILEHFGRHEFQEVLRSWQRLLKPGGTLRIAVPDLEKCVEHYNEHRDLVVLRGLFYGGQRDGWDYHTIGFDLTTLKDELEKAGFVSVERYDWRTFLPDGFDDYSRSYLPHMDFENGKLMSLNVKAVKQK